MLARCQAPCPAPRGLPALSAGRPRLFAPACLTSSSTSSATQSTNRVASSHRRILIAVDDDQVKLLGPPCSPRPTAMQPSTHCPDPALPSSCIACSYHGKLLSSQCARSTEMVRMLSIPCALLPLACSLSTHTSNPFRRRAASFARHPPR